MASNKIPVIDISALVSDHLHGEIQNSPNVIKEIASASLEYGFFYVTGHGIEASLQKDLFENLWKFFSLPLTKKNEIRREKDSFRGYFGKEEEVSIETNMADLKEGMYYFQDVDLPTSRPGSVFNGTNPWPKKEYVENFRKVFLDYFHKTIELGAMLTSATAVGLGLHEDFFKEKFSTDPFVQMAVFHYPPHKNLQGNEIKWGVQEHTDYGMLTMLLQDDVGGLQVQLKDGKWIEVPPIPNSFVINIGDVLELWTSGAYRATPHRVRASPTKDRMSVALFYDPCFECVVTPIPLDKTVIPIECATKLKREFPFKYGNYVAGKYKGILY